MYGVLIWEINGEKSVFLRRSVNNAQTLTLTKKESSHMTTAKLSSVSTHLCLLFPWLNKLTLDLPLPQKPKTLIVFSRRKTKCYQNALISSSEQ